MIDWTSDEMHVFGESCEMPHLPGHIWLSTSGTFKKKWVALSKTAFLASAEAVNNHLKATSQDIWLQPLPNHHVGGLSIWARAYLSGTPIIDYPDVTRKKWDAAHYYQTLVETGTTLTSLVPTQLYDLQTYTSPKSLRAILIGGGYLSQSLYTQARSNGWPVIPTYGCTECCSQIATGAIDDPKLKVLPHIETKMNETLHIRSAALFTAFYDGTLYDPKEDGWYNTGDIVEITDRFLKPLGRADEQYKIRGEKVLLGPLKQLLEELNPCATLRAIEDDRLGHKLVIVAEKGVDAETLLKTFNNKIPAYARVDSIVYTNKIERNALGKVINTI